MHQVLQPLKDFAAWIRGCDCCEDQRLLKKKVVCVWQGCRASSLGQRLETTFGQLRALRTAMRADSPEADVVLTRMLHSLKLKMAWVSDEPALIWQAWDPSIAGEFIQKRDALVADGKQPHRVTELFAELGQPLRKDMERHAAGQGMSRALRGQLLAYSLAKIDDTWAETSHRDVSLFSSRSPGSKVAYLLASHRKGQHLAMYDQFTPGQQVRFCGLMKLYKSIGQRSAQRRRVLRNKKVSKHSLASFVYRYDIASTRDWEETMSREMLHLLPQPKASGGRRSSVTRLQRDYLHHVLPEGEVLSLPASAVANGPAEASPGHDLSWFQVVHKDSARQRRQESAATSKNKDMRYQASLQRLLPWKPPPEDEASAVPELLVPDGDPEVVDLLTVADWAAWTTTLMRWRQARSVFPGCASVEDGQVVSVDANWKDSSVPAWTVVKALADAGWAPGPAPEAHTLASAKLFDHVEDAVTAKAYLRCLLGLPELLNDQFTTLFPGQANKYYDCVLRASHPQEVPVGMSATQYKEVLLAIASGQPGQLDPGLLLQIQASDPPPAICDEEEEDKPIMGGPSEEIG